MNTHNENLTLSPHQISVASACRLHGHVEGLSRLRARAMNDWARSFGLKAKDRGDWRGFIPKRDETHAPFSKRGSEAEWFRMIDIFGAGYARRYLKSEIKRLPVNLPGDDHCMEFYRGRQMVAHVSLPYCLNSETIAGMDAAAELYGLQYAIQDNEPGWWYPGKTHFIVWTRRGDPILQQIVDGDR